MSARIGSETEFQGMHTRISSLKDGYAAAVGDTNGCLFHLQRDDTAGSRREIHNHIHTGGGIVEHNWIISTLGMGTGNRLPDAAR
jgi:hypothetical protein